MHILLQDMPVCTAFFRHVITFFISKISGEDSCTDADGCTKTRKSSIWKALLTKTGRRYAHIKNQIIFICQEIITIIDKKKRGSLPCAWLIPFRVEEPEENTRKHRIKAVVRLVRLVRLVIVLVPTVVVVLVPSVSQTEKTARRLVVVSARWKNTPAIRLLRFVFILGDVERN